MKIGIENIQSKLDVFKNKRVGLITNHTGRNTIRLLQKQTNLVCLFAPEHGINGEFLAGVRFENYIDSESGLMVYSLYTSDKKPPKEALEQIDILCIDIQDVGSRFYTYIYTMAYAMISCQENNKTFVVFDRPNPINGIDVEGNILDMNYRSFIGYYPIVQRHGMTIAELAKMFNEEFKINCDLEVVLMEGWDRFKYYDELNLPWQAPSPSLISLETAIVYNGTCVFEGTNISEGRGTNNPFEVVGAPFINSTDLKENLDSLHLPGVEFLETSFVPTRSKFVNELCYGIYLKVNDRHAFKPVKTGWAILYMIRKLYPNDFSVTPPLGKSRCTMLEFNTGCNYIIESSYTLQEQFNKLEEDTVKFEEVRKQYLLY